MSVDDVLNVGISASSAKGRALLYADVDIKASFVVTITFLQSELGFKVKNSLLECLDLTLEVSDNNGKMPS